MVDVCKKQTNKKTKNKPDRQILTRKASYWMKEPRGCFHEFYLLVVLCQVLILLKFDKGKKKKKTWKENIIFPDTPELIMSLDEALVNFVLLLIRTTSFPPAIFMQIRLADGTSVLISSVLVNDINAELIAVWIYAYETSDGSVCMISTEWISRPFNFKKKQTNKQKKKHST